MADLLFVGQFIASKAGKTGLTVTVDVDRYTLADGSRTALVTAGSATEGRRGLYHYRLASADLATYQYVATFITADATVDQQEIAALGIVVPDALVGSRLAPAVAGRTLDVDASGNAAANVTYWAGQATSHTDGTPDTNLKWINGVQLAPTSSEGYLPAEIDAFSEAAIRTAIGLATANMDTQLAAVAKTGADGDTLETLSDQIDAAALEATAQAILEDTGTTLPTAIAAIEPGGGSYAGDGIGYYSDTIDDGTSPLDGVRVQLYTSPNRVGPAYEAYTNALGVFEMWPDPGTYYRWLDLAGYNFSQDVAVTVTEP